MILAIDPGNEVSGVVRLDGAAVLFADVMPNADVLELIRLSRPPVLAIEMIASYGMPVGAEVFDTCRWIGRMEQVRLPHPAQLVFRRDVKLHLCGSARAKDANIRQALIDRWGGKARAVGTSKQRGPLYGVKSHAWAALAVAVTVRDTLPIRRAA